MFSRISDIKMKQIVCVKNGCVLGYPGDVEFSCPDGKAQSLIIFGRLRFFGILGRDEDIVIPWSEIEVIGQETILVNTDPAPFVNLGKRNRFFGV